LRTASGSLNGRAGSDHAATLFTLELRCSAEHGPNPSLPPFEHRCSGSSIRRAAKNSWLNGCDLVPGVLLKMPPAMTVMSPLEVAVSSVDGVRESIASASAVSSSAIARPPFAARQLRPPAVVFACQDVGSEQTKTPPERSFPESRRPDSNRGPLHYEG
jgi:hypothetical protein